MFNRSLLTTSTTFLFILGLILLAGCAGDENGTGPTTDPEGAALLVAQANSALENVLYELINGPDPEVPSDIDFTEPNSLYLQALELDPNNLDANFGAGLCGLMMVAQDQDVQQAWDDWAEFLGEGNPFAGSPPPELRFPSTISCFDIPVNWVPKILYRLPETAWSGDPRIRDLQNLFRTELLPRIDQAILRFRIVANHPDYVFTISPMMQGDPNEDALELDHTEICAALVELSVVRALAGILAAYDLNIPSYNEQGLVQALTPGSNFLSLTNDGASLLTASQSSMLNAIDDLEEGIDFLRSETDFQGDDIIKIDWNDLTEADLDSILAYTDDARQALTGNWSHTYELENGSEMEITTNLDNFFAGNIDDFKELAPDYTIASPEPGKVTVTWEALTPDQWIFPDPTFRGLLPGMTDPDFKQIINFNPDHWERVIEIEIGG